MNIFNDKEFEENSDYEVIEYFILIIFLIIGSTLCFIQLLLGLAINGAVLFYLFAGQKKVKRIKKSVEIIHKDRESLKKDKESLEKEVNKLTLIKDESEIDILNYKKTVEELNQIISNLQKDKELLNTEIEKITLTKEQIKYCDLNEKIKLLEDECIKLNNKKDLLNKEVMFIEDNITMQSFGFNSTNYNFETSQEYKEKLEDIRRYQKEMVRARNATNHSLDWTINNDRRRGRKSILDNIKLSLRAFNNECDNIISKVKYGNIHISKVRINKAFKDINSLIVTHDISITEEYLELKLQELELKYDYECKLQEEKEKQREEREKLKEEKKVRKEIANMRVKLEKEEQHFINAITELKNKINNSSKIEREKLLKKIEELQKKLREIELAKEDIYYRELNNKAGYVYIISNIGSFGKDVYKIGMTRRLDPMERIKELSSASVPFAFDVHAMIFTEDAPKLEAKLHERFRNSQINKSNNRKEFFKSNIDTIEKVVKEDFDKPVDFIKSASASEYKESLIINFREILLKRMAYMKH